MIESKIIDLFSDAPQALDTMYLSKALGISRTKSYSLIVKENIPYYKLRRKIIIFKQNFFEWLKSSHITPFFELTLIKNLPNTFNPTFLIGLLNISKSKAYEIIKDYNLNNFCGKRIIIFKDDFIKSFTKILCHKS